MNSDSRIYNQHTITQETSLQIVVQEKKS